MNKKCGVKSHSTSGNYIEIKNAQFVYTERWRHGLLQPKCNNTSGTFS